MNTQEITPIELEETGTFDDLYHFKARKDEIMAFKAATGRKGAEFMRQAMRQITRQLTEPGQKAS